MKKNISRYFPAIIFLTLAFLISVYAAFGSYIGNPYTPSISIPGSPGQILINNNGVLGVVSNGFATTSPYGNNEINIGSYANYPDPSGMFNLYDESTSSPVLSASFMASTSQYGQVFGQNLVPAGSYDFVVADDKGTATSTNHYTDFGIANSTQSDSGHTLILPYDAYLYSQGAGNAIPGLILRSNATVASSSIILSVGMQASSPSFSLDRYGHIITSGANSGSLSGCGTSPSSTGNDNNGVITLGTGISVTSCTKAFSNPFPTGSTVSCSITSGNSLSSPSLTSVSTTGFTVGLSVSLGGGKIYYQCVASQ